MIQSNHMHPKPSLTLFCKQIYDLEIIQLDSKFVTCFLPTCGTTTQPATQRSLREGSTEPYH